ncbi:Transmembrane and immunoglobulin domain-containing protein 1 [Oryzias melastigma]|nr:Transmembrane and immunoglobulin domain-containing protein 1 [Oryzias melastigma]
MKYFFGVPLHLLLLLASQTCDGVMIKSTPPVNAEGFIRASPDDTVSLICEIPDINLKEEELKWQRNGAAVSLNDQNKKTGSALCITPVIPEDHAAIFTCSLAKNSTDSASVTLEVLYPPQVSGSENITIEEQEDLVLVCDMKANPLITSVTWTLNESTVDLIAGGFTVTNDGRTSRLQVNNVEQSLHDGVYQCNASSSTFPNKTKTFYVNVTDRTIKFPLVPLIAGVVVVFVTSILAVVSRWRKIVKCCKK